MSDKIDPVYPKASTNIKLKVDGVFAFPDQWRVTDQANPGMFTYVIKFCNVEVTGGKIHPKELTQKQLREQQQAKKKGGKKQAKKQENPAQAQKLKQLQQKEEAEEKKRQQLWNKMSEQERFYSSSQDKYKSALLKFQNGSIEKTFSDNLFVVFQEHVLKDGGQWVYIFKQPTANEQDLDKLKKSKPKNLNINDLNPLCIRAWVNLNQLRSSQVKQFSLRCKLHQVDATQQTPKPNLQKSYIKLTIGLNQPLLGKKDQYSTSTLIKDPPKPKQIPANVKCVQQMNQQLRLAIQSLAMQYSNMFWKDLNISQQQKNTSIFVNNKKNEHVKRKQQFLYDFNVSGKYKVLKQRLKKAIVHLCQNKFIDKMEGSKSFTGITCSVRDQFYSQIYNFLVTSYSDTIQQLISEKKQKLHQVFVLNQSTQDQQTEQVLQNYKKQTKQQRFIRIINQYNIVGNFQYGQSMYKNAIAKDPNDVGLKYQYSIFCVKNGLNTLSQVLSWGYIQQYLEHHKDDKKLKIQYVLLLIGSQDVKSLKKAWVILRQLIQQQPSNIHYLLYAAILVQILGKNQSANKFIHQAYRQQLRNHGKIKQIGKHSTQPIPSEVPSLTSIATYKIQLQPQQKNTLWISVIDIFSQLNIFNIVQKVKSKIHGQNNPALKKQSIKILYAQQNYKQCKQKAKQLYNQSKDYEVLKTIVNCCHKLKQPQQKFNYLKQGLIDSSQDKKAEFLLNLGFFYLMTQKYGNAIACITKYLNGNNQAGGLSWQILGISQFKCNNYQTAIECFRHSNLCDPQNKQVWIWLAQAYSKINNLVMTNQCLNIYMDSVPDSDNKKKQLKETKSILQQSKTGNFYDNSIKQKLLHKLQVY